MENQVATQEKTNKLTGFCYSFGEIGSQLSWYMINTYLTVFYTDIVGLSASAISLIKMCIRDRAQIAMRETLKAASVSEEEAAAYYEENKEQYKKGRCV